MTSSEASRELARAAASVRRLGRRLALTRAAGVVGVAAILVLALSRIAAGRLERPGSILPMLLACVLLASVGLAGLAAGATVRAFRTARRSAEVERAGGLGRGELRGALELTAATVGSRELADLQRQRVAAALRGRRGRELLPDSHAALTTSLRITIPILGLALILGMLGSHAGDPEDVGRAAALLRPWSIAFPPPPPSIEVTPPGGDALRGSSFPFRVSAFGRERVYVGLRRPGRPARTDTLVVRAGLATGRLDPVDEEIHFWVTDDRGSATDTFVVAPIDPVTIVDLAVSLRFPPYLGRPDEVLRGSTSLITVPRGTRLDFAARANHPLLRLGLVREGEAEADTVWLTTGRELAEGGFVARRPAALSWFPVPVDDVPVARGTSGIELSVVPDRPPELRLSSGAGRFLGIEGRIPLLVEAADDHGLASVELAWWRETATGRRDATRREQLAGVGGARRVVLRPVLDVSAAELLPGDEISFFASAADHDRSTPPTVTDTFRVRVASLSERREENARGADALTEELRSLSSRTSDLGAAARDAERRASREGSAAESRGSPARPDYAATEESRNLVREAERVQEALASSAERLETLKEQVADSPWPDRELRRQLEELEGLLEELRTSGLADEIEALNRALEGLERSELRQALSHLSERSADLSAQLERALGLMERVALEQALEAARETAAELASRQRRDSKAQARGDAWSERLDATAAESEELADRLAALAERLEEEGARRAARSGRQAGEDARAAAENLRASAEAARGGERSREEARTASRSLDRARDRLEAASRQLAEDWGADSREIVSRAANEALDLAEEQGRLAEELREGDAAEELASRQAGLREGLDNLTRTLAEAGRRTALLDRRSGPAAARAGREMDALERSLAAGGRRSQAAAQAESAMQALSELAGSLISSRRVMEQASTGTGMEEALERLSRLGRQQADLNGATGDLLLMLRGGRTAGEELRALADGQDEVAAGLRELEGEPASADLAARPAEMAREAEAIARELDSGILTPETLARQERLFRRLLDAGRSLEQDEEDSSRREARAAEPGVALRPADREVVRSGPRYPYPDEASMTGLDAMQRRLVYDYFDRLNRESLELEP